jgi:uncharacterized membrane protein
MFDRYIKISKKTIILLLCCMAVVLCSIPLLRSDCGVYIKWCIMAAVLGLGFWPLTSSLFSTFSDRGWIFSKVIGIALSGFMAFALITSGAADFNTGTVLICTAVLIAACWILKFVFGKRLSTEVCKTDACIDIDLILLEELLFLGVFLMWTYFAGFNPQAYGTEKFMDYGFMAAMMRDETLPARDLWYSLKDINYYYGGQYYAVFLTKLTGSSISVTYNLMRTFVAAFGFALPFGIVYHLIKDRMGMNKPVGSASVIGGAAAGTAVSLAGNMHYVLYGLLGSVFKLSGYEDYWFPDSTRYIGHNPATYDECIHEFPSYSFVLGDLHAHVVNVIFVLCFAGILYAWFRKNEERLCKNSESVDSGKSAGILSAFKDPYIWLLGLFLGIFQFTNYWDFVIYLTAGVIGVILLTLRHRGRITLWPALIRAGMLAAVSFIAAIPFNATFETMAQGLGIAQYHSAFYQMVILWGLPVGAVIMLFVFTVRRNLELKRGGAQGGYISNLTLSDMTALLFGICAIGLVLIPEVVYIKDIYENGFARCNTMFKLTYQAFMLFGLALAYSIFRILSDAKKLIARVLAAALLFMFILTCGYFPYSVSCWFGDVSDTSLYQGLDATAYIETSFPEDAEAIRWLNENIEGNPVVLEAPGDSYSDYERVSSMTGLPTVVGWYVHEWLWRNDPADLDEKIADVETVYTSGNLDEVERLIEEYDIEYIFVGSCEREKYGGSLNEEMLQSLGETVFKGTTGENPAYIIKVDR